MRTPKIRFVTSTAAHEATRASPAKHLTMNSVQAGDPEKAATALMQLAAEARLPLLLGQAAYHRAAYKLGVLRQNFASWPPLLISTSFGA